MHRCILYRRMGVHFSMMIFRLGDTVRSFLEFMRLFASMYLTTLKLMM